MTLYELMRFLGDVYYQHGNMEVVVDGKKFELEVKNGQIEIKLKSN